MLANGLYKGDDRVKVWEVANGVRRHVPNEGEFLRAFGDAGWDNVRIVSSAELNAVPEMPWNTRSSSAVIRPDADNLMGLNRGGSIFGIPVTGGAWGQIGTPPPAQIPGLAVIALLGFLLVRGLR